MADPMKNAKQLIKAQGIAARQDRMGGFKATNDVNAAIYGNLATTQSGLARTMTGQQAKQLRALAGLQSKAEGAAGRTLSSSRNAANRMFGAAIGSNADFSAAAAQGKAGKQAGRAIVSAGGIAAKGYATAAGIAKQGAAQAASGAAYETAQALRYRAGQDAQLQAQNMLELEKMKLQNQLDLQNYRAKLAMQQKADAGAVGMTQLTDEATNQATFMRDWFAQHPTTALQDGTTRPSNAADAYGAYIAANPTTQGGAEDTLAMRLSKTVYQSIDPATGQTRTGYTAAAEASDTASALQGLYPHFDKHQGDITNTITAGIHDYWLNKPKPGAGTTPGMVTENGVTRPAPNPGMSAEDQARVAHAVPFQIAAANHLVTAVDAAGNITARDMVGGTYRWDGTNFVKTN